MVCNGFVAFFSATLAFSCVLVDAQPPNWPLMPKVLATPSGSTLRGSAQWTPASSVDGVQGVNGKLGKDFLLEVEAALGRELPDGKDDRFITIVEGLRPTYESLDKNEYGNLGHTAVRYILHRLFVARHGWRISGLDPAGQHFNASSPVQVFAGKVPIHAQGLFEQRLSGQGLGLQELAVFAALLENLISQEAKERVVRLFEILSLPMDVEIKPAKVSFIYDAYLTGYILGMDLDPKTTQKRGLLKRMELMPSIYTAWKEMQQFVRQIHTDLFGSDKPVSIKGIQSVVLKVGEAFGKKTNQECQDQKKRLINLEIDEKGCVPFSSFYKPMVESNGKDWHFGETPEYLGQLGIVDDSDPGNSKVMIPNYLYAQSNCIAGSAYYSVCCIDECEALLGHVEQRVQSPSARPFVVAAIVSQLPSSTEPARRNLTSAQMGRLQKIAEKHDGWVPIHGRLFMQWMHNVYPRECPYPHLSGTTQSMLPDAYTEETGKESTATMEQMMDIISASSKETPRSEGQCGRWAEDEELLVSMPTRRLSLRELENDVHTWVAASSVALVCAVAALALLVISTLKSFTKSLAGSNGKHALVLV